MSEDYVTWEKLKEEKRKKKINNKKSSLNILKSKNIPFKVLNELQAHYKVGEFDFWATTGKYYNQKTKEKGRGIFNLLKTINKSK